MRRLFLIVLLLTGIAVNSSAKARFAWGAEIGTGVDMSSDDMSTLNIAAYAGCKMPWLTFVGLGTGIDSYMSQSYNSYPIYFLARTSFSPKPRLMFGELRVGMAINEVTGQATQTGLYLRPGLGFQLAVGKGFRSYLMISYLYNSLRFPSPKVDTTIHGLNQAVLTLGISF
ncbi:MAG: hypothetical protein K2K55_00890 [Duncaniella sp.]|nr:hypothetical protein [Duncaniella sp.]